MSNVVKGLMYTKKHEWVKIEDSKARIGITDFAQEELGEIVFVELPEVGGTYAADDEIASLESVKAAAAMYNPLSGEVAEVNEELEDSPELINDDPYENYIYVLTFSDPAEIEDLLDSDGYSAFLDTLED
ncbi:MAG: glycine cleavage system protein GcvH [Spirochaetia bacterium]|nr:glycine cleavage system protein GcvH [Spirochaetia bacterium]